MKRKKKKKKKNKKQAKRPINRVIRLIQNGISEFGLKSMVVAELFLRLARAIVVRPSLKDLNIPTGIERLTDGGRTTFSAVFLDMYLFGDSSLTEERIGHIETAFAFAIPTWCKEDPQAADHAAMVLSSLAAQFSGLEDFGKWEAMSKRLLDMCRTHLGHNRQTLALILGDMGSHYAALGRFAEASDCLLEALTICESDPEFQRAFAPKFLSDLSGIAIRQGEFVWARIFIDQAAEILTQAPETDKIFLLATLINSATLFQETGDVSGFDRVSQQATMVAKEVWESDPSGAVSFVIMLIQCNQEPGREDDAERLIRWLAGKVRDLALETGVDVLDRLIEQIRSGYGSHGLPANLESILAQIKAERDCPTGQ